MDKIKDMPQMEQPQERLLRYGPENLSNSELLAIILRTGTKRANVIKLSNNVINSLGGLNGLLESSKEELMSINGRKPIFFGIEIGRASCRERV